MNGRVMYRLRGRLRRVRKMPEWAVARFETVTGEDRGTLAVLFASVSVAVIGAIMAGFVTYRAVYRTGPAPIPAKIQDGDDSTGEQERYTNG